MFSVISILFFTLQAQSAPVSLLYAKKCTYRVVAQKLNITLNSAKALPRVILASQISKSDFAQFQYEISEQLGEQPDSVINFYSDRSNRIYINNLTESYYKRQGGIDGSLAHEFVHYLQYKYMDFEVLQQGDHESQPETIAVTIQGWYLEKYMGNSGWSPCSD